MADDVGFVEVDKVDTFDTVKYALNINETGVVFIRQVNLGDVTGDDSLRSSSEAGEEHFHLGNGRILGFIEDDE